jgi:hypothetical protein
MTLALIGTLITVLCIAAYVFLLELDRADRSET